MPCQFWEHYRSRTDPLIFSMEARHCSAARICQCSGSHSLLPLQWVKLQQEVCGTSENMPVKQSKQIPEHRPLPFAVCIPHNFSSGQQTSSLLEQVTHIANKELPVTSPITGTTNSAFIQDYELRFPQFLLCVCVICAVKRTACSFSLQDFQGNMFYPSEAGKLPCGRGSVSSKERGMSRHTCHT